jgi:uncharacterized Fe-S cluster protein YjdI
MQDVAPELLKIIKEDFESNFNKSETIANLYEKVRDGTATYAEANEFAIETGELLANAFQRNISSDVLPDGKMYYNIGKRVVEPLMIENYNLVSDICQQAQTCVNKNANIGIKAMVPELNNDRINGIINRVSSEDSFDDIAWILDEPVKNFSQSIVDDSIRKNAEFQYGAGMQPKIVRKLAGGCCDWCREVSGTYKYPDVPKDVYRRHQRCRCTVDYDSGNGKVQNVHTKKWQTQEERDKIEARKIAGLKTEDDVIQKHIRENIIPKQNIDNIVDRQQIHRVGSPMYEQRKISLERKSQYGPSYLTITDDKILELVRKYSGKGKIGYDRNGNWNNQEVIVTNEEIIGVVFNNTNGKSAETSVFKIHYANDGVHIVPDYPSKKR